MTYRHSMIYYGDDEYNIETTGHCCIGDQIRFTRATFIGNYPYSKFNGFTILTGIIINDSYGKKKQQHTFTILLDTGKKISIRGRTLNRYGVWRKNPDNEERERSLAEQHERRKIARIARYTRLLKENWSIYDEYEDYDDDYLYHP